MYILPPNPSGKNSTNFQINPGTTSENKNSKEHNIKILLDSSGSVSALCNDILHERHKSLKER